MNLLAWFQSRLFATGIKGTLFRLSILIGVAILITFPTLRYGFPEIGDDSHQHVLYITYFSQQLLSGELYPRWLSQMNAGLGSPTFFYYPPLSYFITTFMPSWLDSKFGWGPLGVSASLAVILSGLFMYRWLREFVEPAPALLAALLYVVMPYHVAVDIYTRGAFAELWGFVWMPLILFFTAQVGKGRRFAMAALALSYAALITTHLPTTLIFSAVPVTCAAFGRVSTPRRTVLLKVIGAMLVGIALAAIYLVPALGMRSFVHLTKAASGFFYYENWFLFSKAKLWGDETSKLSVMLILVLVPILCAVYLVIPNRALRKDLILYGTISAIALFMMVPVSKPIWKLLPPLQNIQFPYRINSLLCVTGAALLALGFSSFKEHTKTIRFLAALVIVGCVSVWMAATVLAAKSAYLRFNPVPEYAAELERVFALSVGGWEFWPTHTDIEAEERTLERVVNGELSPPVRVVNSSGSVAVEDWQPRKIVFTADLPNDSVIHVNQLYFPLWTARDVDSGAPAKVGPSDGDGLVSIALPAGRHRISLTLEPGIHERMGRTISAVGALLLLILIVVEFKTATAKHSLGSYS